MKFIVLITAVVLLAISPTLAEAQQPSWISPLATIDTSTRVSFADRPLLAGGAYNFTFRINVPFNSTENLVLSTALEQASSQYWYLQGRYAGIDLSQWTPGVKSIIMRQIGGTATISLIGRIPANLTERKVIVDKNIMTLRFENSSYPVASLNLRSSGSRVGLLSVTVKDQALTTYDTTLQAKESLSRTPGIEKTYSQFLNSIIQQARQLHRAGLVVEATNVLNQIPASVPSEPKPPEPSQLPLLLGGVAGILVVGLVGMAFMTLRLRGKMSFLKSSVLDEAGKLDVSLVRIQRTDKAVALEIEQIKNRLKEVSS